jgi:hypothetical protein
MDDDDLFGDDINPDDFNNMLEDFITKDEKLNKKYNNETTEWSLPVVEDDLKERVLRLAER